VNRKKRNIEKKKRRGGWRLSDKRGTNARTGNGERNNWSRVIMKGRRAALCKSGIGRWIVGAIPYVRRRGWRDEQMMIGCSSLKRWWRRRITE